MATRISYYFDEMMRRAVANALLEQGIAVVMAVDIGMVKQDDPVHLLSATEHGAVIVTFDREFAGLTSRHTNHAGLICWTGADTDVGGMIRKLREFAEGHEPEQVAGRVFWLKS